MTNLTNIDLSTLNLKDLQTLAKEFKVKSWWTMKKADLIAELAIRAEEQKAEQEMEDHTTKEDLEDLVEKALKELETEDQTQEKETKTPKAKTSKAPKVEKNEENLVTLKELAAEFKMKGTKARRLLRNETAARPFGGNRWEWDKDLHKAELELARSILKAHTK